MGSYGPGIVPPRFTGPPPYLPPPVPYPVYYYPPPNQPGPIYPVRSNVPYHIGAPNPWANFPAPSPTGVPTNPNWTNNMKKKSPDSRKDEAKIQGIPQENKSPAVPDVKPVLSNIDNITAPGTQNLLLENCLAANIRPNPLPHYSGNYLL